MIPDTKQSPSKGENFRTNNCISCPNKNIDTQLLFPISSQQALVGPQYGFLGTTCTEIVVFSQDHILGPRILYFPDIMQLLFSLACLTTISLKL